MDEIKKKKVITLHTQGLGYKAIAKQVAETPSAVRCVILKIKNNSTISTCLFCGKKFNKDKRHKEQKFCSTLCRVKYNQKANKTIKRICPVCNKTFMVNKRSEQIYCSRECYFKSRYN